MDARSSRPEEQPPRRHGGRLAWLSGTLPAIAGIGFVVIVIIVLVVVLAT